MSEIEVVPRISILNGEVVYEEDDDFHKMDVGASEAVNRFIKDYGKALIVDLNGIQSNRPRLDFIKLFEKKPIWVDAGVRTTDAAIDIFIGGAERTVLRTEILASMDELRKAHELSDQLIFQIDARDGRVLGSEEFQTRSPEDLMDDVARIGVRTCLYLEQGRGVPPSNILRYLPEDFELYVGPLPASDSARFEDSGFRGILVEARELL